jgi:hypothetical protein
MRWLKDTILQAKDRNYLIFHSKDGAAHHKTSRPGEEKWENKET